MVLALRLCGRHLEIFNAHESKALKCHLELLLTTYVACSVNAKTFILSVKSEVAGTLCLREQERGLNTSPALG